MSLNSICCYVGGKVYYFSFNLIPADTLTCVNSIRCPGMRSEQRLALSRGCSCALSSLASVKLSEHIWDCQVQFPSVWHLLLLYYFLTPACRGFNSLTFNTTNMSAEQSDSNSTGYYFDNQSTRVQRSFVFSGPMFVILMVMMVTLVVVIVLGNALVILAFKVDKSLRRQCNYYFLNLAISDFLVGESSFF